MSGRIEQDTTWTQDGSPFVLIGQVVVVADVTLTIEPGAQVRGTVGSSLVVNGALNAVGTQEQRIIFTSESGQQDWSGIHLTTSVESSPRPSALRFVTIERATRGIKWGLTRSSVEFSDNQLDGNGIALVFENPIGGTGVQRSVFTNNRIAVTGKTRELVGIYENDFWNNEINLLPRPESPYDCGQDDGVWDIHSNDILRGALNSEYLSNDVQTPSGSGVSEYAVSATDNWWGTTDDLSIRARTRENLECCPPPWRRRSSGSRSQAPPTRRGSRSARFRIQPRSLKATAIRARSPRSSGRATAVASIEKSCAGSEATRRRCSRMLHE